jgi:hypothetical protein
MSTAFRFRALAAEPFAALFDYNDALLRERLLSLRAYDGGAMMIAAECGHGRDLEETIDTLFADERVRYLHVHNARPGCFVCAVERT